MKSKITILVLGVITVFSMSNTPLVPETHIITLYVDTANIENGNIDDTCNFGQDQDVSNIDYTIQVNKGDIVMWRGVSTSSAEDMVQITSINYQGGARVFDKNVLTDSQQSPGVVVGTVNLGKEGDEEKYTVSFKVFNNGTQRNGTFHIDPKLQIKN